MSKALREPATKRVAAAQAGAGKRTATTTGAGRADAALSKSKLTPKRTDETKTKAAPSARANEKDVKLGSLPRKSNTVKSLPQKVTAHHSTAEKSQTTKAGATNVARQQAKRVPAQKAEDAAVIKKSSSKRNPVLDSYHSVTVASPPPTRKATAAEVSQHDEFAERTNDIHTVKRVRTRSITLEPEEVIVLKCDSAKKRIEEEILSSGDFNAKHDIKAPIAFEISLDEGGGKQRGHANAKAKATTSMAVDEQAQYSDDFESYESDFETESSSRPESASQSGESSGESDTDTEAGTEGESDASTDASRPKSAPADSEEDSEDLTQNPVTVIQRQKELEHRLDSGNYDTKRSAETKLRAQPQQLDSIETFSTATSDQFDSGLSSCGNLKDAEFDACKATSYAGGYVDFSSRPFQSQRGMELMSKIQFDTISFVFLDMKPISYEMFMKTYGKMDTTQSSTQTHESRLGTETQTDEWEVRSVWTQHPAQFDLQTVQDHANRRTYTPALVHNCCGEALAEERPGTMPITDGCDASLKALTAFHQGESKRRLDARLQHHKQSIDFEKLNLFLINASLLVSQVLTNAASGRKANLMLNDGQAEGTFTISSQFNTSYLDALTVVRVFASAEHNLLITVHASLPNADVYRSEFANLLMVWSTLEPGNPIRLLSAWSEVCHGEISATLADIVVCGLSDGSLAMWDLRETYSFCSKLDGHLTHFAATQSIVPVLRDADGNGNFVDLGAVIHVISVRAGAKRVNASIGASHSRTAQFISLNDRGVLAIWTLVETGGPGGTSENGNSVSSSSSSSRRRPKRGSHFEYNSPWARVKLIQSAVLNLREYLEKTTLAEKSHFDKTKELFEKNIANDHALQELHEQATEHTKRACKDLRGIRFTQLCTECDQIFVCTNRNIVLACSKSLNIEHMRKIVVNENRYLFPTALCVLGNEMRDFLAVGLSNGCVVAVNGGSRRLMLDAMAEGHHHTNSSRPASSSATPNAHDTNAMARDAIDNGKSCIIQNIILNERRPHAANDMVNNVDHDLAEVADAQLRHAPGSSAGSRPNTHLQMYDKQLLLGGSVLRKDMIQSLQLSADKRFLFALSDGEVRIFDIHMQREMGCLNAEQKSGHKFVDMAVVRAESNRQQLVTLTTAHEVFVYRQAKK